MFYIMFCVGWSPDIRAFITLSRYGVLYIEIADMCSHYCHISHDKEHCHMDFISPPLSEVQPIEEK